MNFINILGAVWSRKMVPIRVHPSVLVTCSIAQCPEGNGKATSLLQSSGSGFILDPEEGLVATSASWITSLESQDHFRHVRRLTRDSFQRKALISGAFRSFEGAKWRVFTQAACQDQAIEEGDEVICIGAVVVGVHLMDSVYFTLEEQLTSLAQWRWSPADSTRSTGTTNRTANDSWDFQSLVLPLSCVVILQLNQKIQPRMNTVIKSPTLQLGVGDALSVIGTPMGSFCPEVFLASVSTGCVSKLLGKKRAVFVTDARCLPGCEGALVVREGNRYPEVVGMVIAPLLTPAGAPAGLSLVCSIAAVLAAIERTEDHGSAALSVAHPPSSALPPCRTASCITVAIATGGKRGSGVLLSPHLVLTCGHVVKGRKGPISVQLVGTDTHLNGKTVLALEFPDVALVKLVQPVTNPQTVEAIKKTFVKFPYPGTAASSGDAVCSGSAKGKGSRPKTVSKDVNQTTRSVSCESLEGQPIFAVGHGLQESKTSTSIVQEPLVTSGVVSKVVRWQGVEVMVVTTAVVHPGMSGGMIVSAATGEPLGMIVSNSEDKESGVVYPDVNYSLPFSWILPPILRFSLTGDHTHLTPLHSCPQGVKDLWKLNTQFTNLHKIPSKL